MAENKTGFAESEIWTPFQGIPEMKYPRQKSDGETPGSIQAYYKASTLENLNRPQ